MSVGGVRDGGCGHTVLYSPGSPSSYPNYATLHDHDNDNNHTVPHDLFQFLDTYTQLMQVQLYNNAYTK